MFNDDPSPTSWCWIKSEVKVASVVFWQFFCGKFWEITAYIIVSVFYAVIVCYLKRQVGSITDEDFDHYQLSNKAT